MVLRLLASAPEIVSEHEGFSSIRDLRTVQNEEGHWVALNKNGSLNIVRDEGRSLEEYKKLLSTKSIEPLQTFNSRTWEQKFSSLMEQKSNPE